MIKPGKTIGILCGRPLEKMVAQAAATLGYKTHIFCPDGDSPAFDVATKHTQASYNDADALNTFGKSVDVIASQYIPQGAIQTLEQHAPVHPSWEVLHISQNGLREKRFINKLGFETAQFEEIHTLNDLQAAVRRINSDSLLKTVEIGHEDKGHHWIDANSNLEAIWETFESECGILEAFVPFQKEIAVIIARGQDGSCAAFPAVENH